MAEVFDNPGASTTISPDATLSGLNSPWGLALDSKGNLYVANSGGTTISKFAPGAATPGATFTGLNAPSALVVDSLNNLCVVDGNGTFTEYTSSGSLITMSGTFAAVALAVDGSNNIYLAYANNTVREYTPSVATLKATFTGVNSPQALVVDPQGNLYVANGVGSTVSKFTSRHHNLHSHAYWIEWFERTELPGRRRLGRSLRRQS